MWSGDEISPEIIERWIKRNFPHNLDMEDAKESESISLESLHKTADNDIELS